LNPRRALSLLTLLVLIGACKRDDAGRDVVLKEAVTSMRGAIARFHLENGRYPQSLEELVPKYLSKIPDDPFTHSSTTWRVTTEETVQPSSDFQTATPATVPSVVIDVHSTAPGADRNGVLYSNY